MAQYIRGKYANAACALVEHLKTIGVSACVGYNSNHRGRELVAYVRRRDDIPKVPRQFSEFSVVAMVEPPSESFDAAG